ncbi:MAG: PAS domain-containing protein [Bryobacteraceae bacterium]
MPLSSGHNGSLGRGEPSIDSEIRAEEFRHLYTNSTLAVGVTLFSVSILSYLQWDVIRHPIVIRWWSYMLAVSLLRFGLTRAYFASKSPRRRFWEIGFLAGTVISACGWGASSYLLYPPAEPVNQVFLIFVLGGMMVGGASVLAARVEAFSIFIILIGVPAAVRLTAQGDRVHFSMAMLSALYTLATLLTARGVHATILSSLRLRAANQGLLTTLQSSKEQAEHLNEKLATEMTERRRATEAVLKSERRLELALFGAELGLFDWNIETGEMFWDAQWEAILEYKPGELKPSLITLDELTHPDDRAAAHRAMREHLQGRKPAYEAEYRMLTKRGEWKWVRARGKIVERDSNGIPIRVTGTHRDVTERHRTEQALRESRQELEIRVQERTVELASAVTKLKAEMAERELAQQERASMEAHLKNVQKLEAIGILAGGIAHDFNNILTSLIGYTQLADEQLDPDSPVHEHLAQVLKAGDRAADLVRRLLLFSRKREQSITLVDIGAVVLEALQLLKASIPTSIDFNYEIEGDCGYVLAEPTLIHQVVMNLCTNAYQAMRGAVGKLDVTLQPVQIGRGDSVTLAEGSYVRLTVKDSGPGIPPEIADRVFEPFFTTKEVGQGTGLGLSVVHGVVSGYGGTVNFESTPGQGTTFCAYLPQVPEGELTEDRTPERSPRGIGQILLVDDEPMIARLGALILEDLGYTVTPTTSSPEALRLFTADPHHFDLVISDFTMPVMTGTELIRELKRIRPDLPVLLISGFHDELIGRQEAESLQLPMTIRKPFSRSDLALAVYRAMTGTEVDSTTTN